MVEVESINEIRPRITDEFHVGPFVPRTEAIQKAYEWGEKIHAGQTRLSGEPYFATHSAWVGAFVDQLVHKEAWTIAALLHDTVEDQGESFEEIRDLFPGPLGEEVAHIVDGVTKMSTPRDGSTREIETLRKIAMFRDPAVFVVKLADKSHNLMTLNYQARGKQWQKANEAIRAYGKLAGILNCYRWRRWIEDMAFPYAEPEAFSMVKAKIDADPRLNLNFIRYYLGELAHLMEAEGIDGAIRFTVNGYWQAWDKLQRMARARRTSLQDFSAVNDIVSFRMLVKENDETACYRLLARVNRYFSRNLDQDRFDDYIASPQNGYRALQVTTWMPGAGAVEIAIATDEMEGENTWGVIYAINNQKDISKYSPVQILTPFGGTRFLQEGSTVLDGVAAIQEFYLDKISKVLVNHEERHIYDTLNPGDLVEVVTSGAHKTPEPDWLNHCNVTTARRLRIVLATVSLKEASKKGKEQIHALLAARGLLDLEDVAALDTPLIEALLGMLACANLDDLYAAVGGGAIYLQELENTLDLVGISRALRWTTVEVSGDNSTNRPGVLSYLAGLVSQAGGNILRTVSMTNKEGQFQLRMILRQLGDAEKALLTQLFNESRFKLDRIEIV
ncbi:MAG TPA: HD domain-containing protein [Anaerolineaceae bacterium]|nr:HD domain-containing protein [Anaerolineaceae bacterium]HPT23375.1 HD domain-containing protein [Anaerolineaceae bacterium]